MPVLFCEDIQLAIRPSILYSLDILQFKDFIQWRIYRRVRGFHPPPFWMNIFNKICYSIFANLGSLSPFSFFGGNTNFGRNPTPFPLNKFLDLPLLFHHFFKWKISIPKLHSLLLDTKYGDYTDDCCAYIKKLKIDDGLVFA